MRRVHEAVDYGATEICMQSGIHPDWTLDDYLFWLRLAKETAPQLHLHAYSPMEIAHMCDISGPAARRGLRAAARRRPGLDAGHGRRGPPRRRARAHQPQQAAGRALGARSSRPRHAAGPALDGHGDVRPHRGAVGAGRAHARRARAAGAHRRDHRVRAAVVHPLPHAARAHARGRGDLARGEPQAHRGLPPRARAHDPEPAGLVGEDGPRRRDRVAVVGRQRPRRHADGGEHQPPGRLLPRRAPGPAAADRRRARRRPPGRRAHDALRRAPRPGRWPPRRPERAPRPLRRALRRAGRRPRAGRGRRRRPRPAAGTASSSGTTS